MLVPVISWEDRKQLWEGNGGFFPRDWLCHWKFVQGTVGTEVGRVEKARLFSLRRTRRVGIVGMCQSKELATFQAMMWRSPVKGWKARVTSPCICLSVVP